MSKSLSSLTIGEVMTRQPATIRDICKLSVAHDMMRQRGIRHLPVVTERGEVTGVLSHRDLYVFEAVGATHMLDTVGLAMAHPAYAVAPSAKLADVAAILAERRLGCAVVVEGGSVVGIFTADDGLRVLAQIIRSASAPA